jgi:Holliday junction resolvase
MPGFVVKGRPIASLARQYESEGYEVLMEPQTSSMLPQLENYRPDLLVRKGDEVIIIEVVSGKTSKEKQEAIEHLARYAKEQKGVRFDLVVTNTRKTRPQKQNRDSKLLKLIQQRVMEEIDASVTSYPAATIILCSLLVENLSEGLAIDESGSTDRNMSVIERARQLQERQIISKSAENFVAQLWEFRNKLLHGLVDRTSITNASDMCEKTKSLLRNYRRESAI